MTKILAFVKRHRLTTFFVLAYALSWWAWILYGLGLFPNPVASFGPFLAAIVVLALTQGKAGILGLFRRMVRWRVAPGWYAVALLLPVVLAAAATACSVRSLPPRQHSMLGPESSRPSQSSFSFQESAGRGRSPVGGATPSLGYKAADPRWSRASSSPSLLPAGICL